MKFRYIVVLFLVNAGMPAWGNKTPSDVYQVTEQIVLEVQVLREHLEASDTPRIPDLQTYKTPIHVFSKSLEVLKKIAVIQQSNGLKSLPEQQIPTKKITSSDVYVQAELVLQQVLNIQAAKNISGSGVAAQLVSEKSSSHAYENLWKASFMLDELAKKIKVTDVYNNMQEAAARINIIAKHLKINVSSERPKADKRTKSTQVLLQSYINLHKMVMLEKKLGLKPFRVPSFPKGKLTSSDAYDSVSMLIAEMSRVNTHLNIKNNTSVIVKADRKRRHDVLATMLMVEQSINALSSGQ